MEKSELHWQDVVDAKRQIRQQLVGDGNPSFLKQPPIYDTKQYHASLLSGETTCESTIRGYIERARDTHLLTNCLTEVAFDCAIQRSKELDQNLKVTGTLAGPLHGIPVTLKDQFNIKGYDTTLGYVGRAFSPAEQDAVLVLILKELGAVILTKSNLPQSIMWCETENPLWGLTTHLVDAGYTPGGSTGGEAVLLANQASCLGWGTDIGGSIRIPSHMQGLYGLKPSSSRLPYRGVPVSTDGQEHVPSSIGPMARSLDTIELAMRAVLSEEPWMKDARCSPIPWREDLYKQTLNQSALTMGVLFDDGVVKPHPPITRVLEDAVERLKQAGHDIVMWNPELHAECISVMDQFYTADGGQDIRDAIAAGGEPLIPHVDRLINKAGPISVYEYWQLNKQKFELQQRYLDKWNELRSSKTGLPADVLVMPPMPHTAVPHRSCGWVGYTKVWNFLDYSAMVIPAGRVSTIDLETPWAEDGTTPRGPADEWNTELWQRNKHRMVELKLPVGIQLVCRRLEEEKLLAAARIVDRIVNGN